MGSNAAVALDSMVILLGTAVLIVGRALNSIRATESTGTRDQRMRLLGESGLIDQPAAMSGNQTFISGADP